ncbi:MAG: MFS transporter [Rubrivivax sp.]|nr:MFS transporter [Rubrivivax sp.]
MTPAAGAPAAGAANPLPRFAALSGAYFAAMGMFAPYSPLWFQSLGMGTLAIGAIASLQSWTRVFTPYGWGWLGDHTGRRVELIRLAAAGALLAALGLLGVRAAVPVAVMTVLLFLANGGVIPLSEATLAHHLNTRTGIDPGRYGRVRVWGSVGFIAAVLLGGGTLELVGIGAFPWLVAALNGLLLVAALRLPRQRDQGHDSDEAPPPVLRRLREPAVAFFFASIFFTVLAHTALYAFFSLYLVQLGYGKTAVGALWAVGVAAEIVFFWQQGRWFRRLAAEHWLQVAAAATAVRFAATAGLGGWPVVIVLAQLSHAFTFAAHHAACIDLVHRHFPGRLRGRGQALYTILGYGISGVLGGVGGGWLIDHLGFAAVFWAAAVAALVSWWCAWRAQVLAVAPAAAPGPGGDARLPGEVLVPAALTGAEPAPSAHHEQVPHGPGARGDNRA